MVVEDDTTPLDAPMSFTSVANSIDAVDDNFSDLPDTFTIPINDARATQDVFGGVYRASIRWSGPSQQPWTWGRTRQLLHYLQDYYTTHLAGGRHPVRILARKDAYLFGYDVQPSPATRWLFSADNIQSRGELYTQDSLPSRDALGALINAYNWAHSTPPTNIIRDRTEKTFVSGDVALRLIVGGDRCGIPGHYPRFEYGDMATVFESIQGLLVGHGSAHWPSFEASLAQRIPGGAVVDGAMLQLSAGIMLPDRVGEGSPGTSGNASDIAVGRQVAASSVWVDQASATAAMS